MSPEPRQSSPAFSRAITITLTSHLIGRLVFAQPDVDRVTQAPAFGLRI
jgi:hypothetical protein